MPLPLRALDPRRPHSVFISYDHAGRSRSLRLSPLAFRSALAGLALTFAWGVASASYILFRDDLAAALTGREAEIRAHYEDRLARSRAELDRVTSRRLMDEAGLEGRMRDLVAREQRLERQGRKLETLANGAGAGATVKVHAGPPPPDPQPREPRGEDGQSFNAPLSPDAATELTKVAAALDALERADLRIAGDLAAKARGEAARYAAIVAETGFSAPPPAAPEAGVGGPFIPIEAGPDASPFDRAAAEAGEAVARLGDLRALAHALPLGEPLGESAPISSPFGYRIDPILGRPALHSGVDFAEREGAEIHAAGDGRVIHAGDAGGYGQMVEIDHGGGVTTRYAHMSALKVAEGDIVKAGDALGRVGSSGRSVGPHLHYEVRLAGEPVDPAHFLEAGAELARLAL